MTNRHILTAVFLCVAAFGCKAPPRQAATTAPPGTAATGTIRIATFNIQNFGKSKAAKPQITAILAGIISRYDVVAVQEVSDISESAPRKLLELLNDSGVHYGMLLSPRSGLQADDRKSQEQYAYYYKLSSIQPVGPALLYDDTADRFQREPYIARFKAKRGRLTFVLLSVHTDPKRAVQEIGAMHEAVTWARSRFPGEDDFIAIGDFNAGCSYATTAQLDALELRTSQYVWIVPDTADTNIATSRCAYDRIVTTEGAKEDFTGRWDVDEAFADKAVSDHWPVWAEFYVGRDR